jgi:hypothetical protein
MNKLIAVMCLSAMFMPTVAMGQDMICFTQEEAAEIITTCDESVEICQLECEAVVAVMNSRLDLAEEEHEIDVAALNTQIETEQAFYTDLIDANARMFERRGRRQKIRTAFVSGAVGLVSGVVLTVTLVTLSGR